MADFTLLRPWWLILLLLPLIFVYVDFAKHYKLQNFIREDIINYLKPKKKKKLTFEDIDTAPDEVEDEKNARTISNEERKELIAKPKLWKKYAWLLIPYFFCVFATTGPAVSQEKALFQANENWIWVIDSSASMLATDLKPSRFQRLRYSLIELLNSSDRHRRIGLIGFTNAPYLISPPTDDNSTLLFFLQELDPSIMPSAGSDPIPALNKAKEILDKDQENPGNILLVIDDVKDEVQVDELVKAINDCPYPVYIYAIGTNMGSPISVNNQYLKDKNGNTVMAKTNLEFINRVARESKSKVFYEFNEDNTPNLISMYSYEHPKYKVTTKSKYVHKDIGYYFAFVGLLALFGFIRNYFFSFVLVGLISLASVCPNQAMAGISDEFSDEEIATKPNEYGYALYQDGKYEEALKYLTDPWWKGNAYYKLGKYEKALPEYQSLGNIADAKYNVGNCFAKLQTPNSLNDAILAYSQALELNPDHTDAAYNKTVILDFLRKIKEHEAAIQQQQQANSEDAALGLIFNPAYTGLNTEDRANLLQRRLLLQMKKMQLTTPEQTW